MPRAGSTARKEEGDGGALESIPGIRFLSGTCPDPKCQTRLHCMSSYQSIECTGCGQLHNQAALLNVKEEKGDLYSTALFAFKSLIAGIKPEPGTDNVKVHGLSNYLCKLLSHLLSQYGMDKTTGRAKLLTEMGQPELFDCGVLCDRAFRIDPEHLTITGYGQDKSGSLKYLAGTLNVVRELNDNEDRLIPIHADGDGHCLVHAVSRALVGRELFWHPLRLNLMHHLRGNLDRYKALFQNFVDVDEWEDIISECQPSFVPKDGEGVGLRNIHIFGLANVLKRPIILLDSLSGISSSGDYSGVFLPALLETAQCKNKEGVLNAPLCIAWSNQGRNHFIPLVGIKDKPCPKLPRYMLQATWGVHPSLLDQYIAFDDQGRCTIGGPRPLHENYIQRLVSAMEGVFYEKHRVHPGLVADVYQYIFRPQGFVGMTLEMVTEKTYQLVKNRALLRCLRCSSLSAMDMDQSMLRKGGQLYELALKDVGELSSTKMYTFTDHELSCRYNAEEDVLVPDLAQHSCPFCQSELKFRYMNGDGTIEYNEGDVTMEPAGPNAQCTCGFKHYYHGKFYDNRPKELPVPLEWGPKKTVEVVQWWENESDPSLDSNVYQIAQDLVLKHFPGEFGIERLQQKIVSIILMLTASKITEEPKCEPDAESKWNPEEASKIIMSGFQRQSVHKEELTKSDTERQVKKKIESHAPQQQSKKLTQPSTSSTPDSKKNSPARTTATKPKVSSSASTPPRGTPTSTPTRQAGTPTPPPTPKPASKEKKIRLVASGGRSETVTLTEDVTFSKLQELVSSTLHIPPHQQKLRLGFPPKILTPPEPGDSNQVVPLNHGDKISVESLPAAVPGTVKDQVSSTSWSSSTHSSIRGHVDAHMPSEAALLDILSARHLGGDSLDNSLLSLNILAETMGLDLWGLVQSQPHHFSRGGLYHRQAERDLGLTDGKHFAFPNFPDKTFVYNISLDRLELCLGDLGHFEVEPDVEKKAREHHRQGHVGHHHHHSSQHHVTPVRPVSGSVAELRREEANLASFGSSGAITRHTTSQRVFEGQGHSLREPPPEDRMPEDVPLTESIQGAARRLQNLCDPEHNRSSIEEEPEKMDTEEKGESREQGFPLPKYTRKGPGFSVLEPPLPPAPIQTAEAVQQLFQSIQDAIDAQDSMESSEDEDALLQITDETVTRDQVMKEAKRQPEPMKENEQIKTEEHFTKQQPMDKATKEEPEVIRDEQMKDKEQLTSEQAMEDTKQEPEAVKINEITKGERHVVREQAMDQFKEPESMKDDEKMKDPLENERTKNEDQQDMEEDQPCGKDDEQDTNKQEKAVGEEVKEGEQSIEENDKIEGGKAQEGERQDQREGEVVTDRERQAPDSGKPSVETMQPADKYVINNLVGAGETKNDGEAMETS